MIDQLAEQGKWGEGAPMPSTTQARWTDVSLHFKDALLRAVSIVCHIYIKVYANPSTM